MAIIAAILIGLLVLIGLIAVGVLGLGLAVIITFIDEFILICLAVIIIKLLIKIFKR